MENCFMEIALYLVVHYVLKYGDSVSDGHVESSINQWWI